MIVLNIPYVQQQLSVLVATELSEVLHARLSIGRINMGFLNRIIIDDVMLEDQSRQEMLKIARLSAKFDVLPLFKGKISISNVQIFSLNAHLERLTPESEPNFQFVLDALASKDTLQKEKKIDLRINSILIRRGKVSYDILSETETPGRFNPHHLFLNNISANLSLKALRTDSLNVAVKRMSFEDVNSGFELKRLSVRVLADNQHMRIENFSIGLPHTALSMDTIRLEYDNLSAFSHFSDSVRCSFHLLPSSIAPQDLATFLPAFHSFKDAIDVEVAVQGTFNQLECSKIQLSAGDYFSLHGNLSLQGLSSPADAYIFGNLSRFYLNQDGIDFFLRNFSKKYQGVPLPLQRVGTVSFQGEISGYFTDLVTYGEVKTDAGNLRTDLKLTTDKENGLFSYSGSIMTDGIELGVLTGDGKWGQAMFNLDVQGKHGKTGPPAVRLDGEIASLNYNGYTYENILLNGEYQQGGFNGNIELDDVNGYVSIEGRVNLTGELPSCNLKAEVSHLLPHKLRLAPEEKDVDISVRLSADFTGHSIDDMNGVIRIDSFRYATSARTYMMEKLQIQAVRENEHHQLLTLETDFMKGRIEGDYSYRTLPVSIQNILHHYLPALVPSGRHSVQTENNFQFELHVHDTELLSEVCGIPFRVYTHSVLSGYFNDRLQKLRIEGYFPRFSYKEKFIESGMLLCENHEDQFLARIRLTNRKKQGAVNVAIDAKASDDQVQMTLDWGNSSEVTYCGKLAAAAHFIREQEEGAASRGSESRLKTVVDIHDTDVVLSDTLWKIHPSQIVVDSGKVFVRNFYFSHEKRHLHIDGTISEYPEDTLRMDLQKINIGYVFDIADLGVNFRGEATGPVCATGLLGKPVMSTDLHIRNFGLNDGLLGDADIHGEWHHEVKGIYLDARINEKEVARTHVVGYVYPIKPTSSLDLQIEAHNTNLKFIHYYMRSITPDFHGRVTGNVHFYGKFKALTMEGKVLGDASLKVEVLNTSFSIKDSILIEPQGLTFLNNRIYDTQGHQGRANGYLRYQHFKNIMYDFRFDINNMLVMNTQESPDYPFYGTVYATGHATIAGNARDGVNIDVAVSTNRHSTFVYMKEGVVSATSSQFITFVDKTPRRVTPDSLLVSDDDWMRLQTTEQESDTDIRLNLLVDVTPDASMRIIMDPIAGDYISGKGSGNIRTEFYNKGDVRMFGNYRISQGVYKFSLQEVIRKDFAIKEGSSISFNGPPLDAVLDIKASYQVNSASLNDLIPNASEYVNQTNIKVNCMMDLTGQLTSPDIRLGIELPNERDEVQALVRNYIPTDEQMNMQILYLLGIGKFYTPENVEVTGNSNMMSSVVSSTISGQLNNALSNIINSNDWNFGTNFSTGEKGWTDVEFETMLSGQLLNNRLLINGNFGYRDNPMANTNFVGDFEAEWLVNRSGDIRLRAYNETNDRYYTKTNMTTQGIGIIFKKEFDKWNELLFWNRWKLKRLEQQRKAAPDTL